jgi:hypothetical protein
MLLAVIAAASLHARITEVGLFSDDAHSALRMVVRGVPEQVVVRRDGDLTRVSLKGTDLGVAFAGGDRFQWLRTESTCPGRAHCPQSLWIDRGRDEVTVSLRLPPDVSVEPRQEASAVLLVFRKPSARTPEATRADAEPALSVPAPRPVSDGQREPTTTQAAPALSVTAPAATVPTNDPRAGSSGSTSSLVAAAPTRLSPESEEGLRPAEPKPPAPSESGPSATPDLVAQLLGTLPGPDAASPAASRTASASIGGNAATEGIEAESLYRRLFPHGAPAPATAPSTGEPETPLPTEAEPDRGFKLGFLTFRPTLRVTYVDTTASLLNDTGTVRDRYLEIQPGLGVGTSLLRGRLKAEYEPTLRSFGNFEPTQSTSHRADASLDLASGGPFQLVVRDSWATGVLEAQEVDPGGEYFFDLQRFRRNSLGATARHQVAPRWTLEASGILNQVRFTGTPGTFFDYDTRTLDLGVDHEISENLRTSLTYVHDQVPRSAERPQAESTANALEASITGQATPRVNARAMLGYREEDHPFAGEGGRRYSGLVAGGSVTRTLGLASSVTLSGTRTSLLSAFEENGFYVTNQVQTDAALRMPYSLLLDAAIAYRWNDYRTVAPEIGVPRADTSFDWRLGFRRLLHWGSIGASYERQQRRSNIDRFDAVTDRLTLQLDLDLFRAAGSR